MKKKILFFVFVFFLLLICSSHTNATFTKDNYIINAVVLENGDMHVEETIQYKTDESKNGVTRTIKLKNPQNATNSATGFELEDVLVDYESCVQVRKGSNGQDKVYEYSYDGSEAYIKLYTPFRYQGKTVKYIYTLKNVAVKYNDIAELYWNFIGNDSTDRTENLLINIDLPIQAAQDTIYVYGHGSDNGKFEKNANFIRLIARDISENQAVDARILFSKNAISTTKVVNKNVLQKYRNLEEGMNNDTLVFGIDINKIAIACIIIIFVAFVIIYKKYHNKSKRITEYVRELPYNLDPEILQYVYYGNIQKNTFWVTFLNLIRKGVFSIEKTTNQVEKETHAIVYEGKDENLPEYEKKATKLILNCMSGKNEKGKKQIELERLKAKLKTNQAYKDYRKFCESIKVEIDATFEEDKKPKKLRTIITIVMALFILFIAGLILIINGQIELVMPAIMLLGITTVIYGVFFITTGKGSVSVLIFLLLHCAVFQMANFGVLISGKVGVFYIPYLMLFILMIYCYRVKIESEKKQEVRGMVKSLRNYIKDYSMLQEKGLEDMVLWGEYLIMAIALGLNNNTINYFYDGCIQNSNNFSDNFGNNLVIIGNYNTFYSGFGSTFSSMKTVSSSSGGSSSYSGSSGGFSGGSSSGGGGRRRWRNWIILKSYKNRRKNMKKYDMNLLDYAIYFATKAHNGQKRKTDKEVDMIFHPYTVAMILQRAGASTNCVIAGVLHDVVEDTKYTLEDIKKEFNEDIAKIIFEVSENKSLSWKERKIDAINKIKTASLDGKLVECADKINNLECLYSVYEEKKDDVWKDFNQPYEEQKWYYTNMYDAVLSNTKENNELFERYKKILDKVFR